MAARLPALLVCGALLVLVGTGAVLAAGDLSDSASDSTSTLLELQPEDDGTANNSTSVQHRDPDAAREDGDMEAVRGWLTDRMADSLRESGVRISEGQYGQGRSVLGDQYDDYLAQFVEVSDETPAPEDDETVASFREAQESQQSFADTVAEYEETYEAYLRAERNGNEERSRELARELNSLATDLEGYNQALGEEYRQLGNQTTQNFTNTTRRLDAVTSNATERATAAQEAELVETELVVQANATNVSFVRPLELQGRLRSAGNESPPDQALIGIGGRTQTVDVAPDGSFAMTYRPRSVPVGDQSLNVSYIPEPTSVYRASNASVNVTVEGVTPTVSVVDATAEAGFGDDVRVAGEVTVDGTAVGDTPVVLTVAGERLTTVRTGADGSFETDATLPSSVEAGTVELTVTAGQEGRAIAPNATTVPLEVSETATALDLDGTTSDGRLNVSGTLATDDGTGVANQTVAIHVEGERATTVQTNADGEFSTAVEAPEDSDVATVQASFNGTTTNLGASTARVRVDLAALAPPGQSDEGLLDRFVEWLPFVGGGFVAILGFALVVRWRRRGEPDPGAALAVPESSSEASEAASPPVADRLEDLDDGNPASLVRETYLTLRDAVGEVAPVSDAATHWEFYRAVVDSRPEFEAEVRELVEAYEVAVFADEPVGADRAERVQAAAASVAEAIGEEPGEADDRADD